LWLDDGNGPSSGRGAQRRRLALLSLLALSPGRRVTRDKAIATLWPENTSAEGRRRLSSAVYDLRNLLGDDAIESAGDELWIASTAAFRVDVDDFEAAFARGDSEGALAAFGGPLLDGVHLSGAGEFEEWIANRRDRLRRQYIQALEQVTAARASRGDHRGAVSSALQLVDLEPLSGGAALIAVNALVAAGDRPSALAIADAHAARVQREFGVDPDDSVLEARRRLRAAPGQRTTPPEHLAVSEVRDAPTAASAGMPAASSRVSKRRTVSPAIVRRAPAAVIVLAAFAAVAFRSLSSATKRDAPGSVSLTGIAADAAHSTTSAAALKSFLDGEAAHESGRYDAAAKLFRAAIARDSTFALAQYRLSETMLWQEEPEGFAETHDTLALAWSSHLPDGDQRLIRAYVAWRRGEYETADMLDRSVLHVNSANVDALFQLSEVLFHYNPLRGRSIGETAAWLTYLVQLDSTNWGARWHLLLLDASRLRAPEFHARVAGLLDARPDGHLAAELTLFAADSAELPKLADGATEAMLFDAAWRRAVFRRDLNGAELLLRRMVDMGRDDYERRVGRFAVATLEFGRGNVTAGAGLLDTDDDKRVISGDARIIFVHGLLANRADTGVDLDTLGRAIERWRQTLAGFDQPTSSPRLIARYLEGLLMATRGDSVGALRAATDLDELGHHHDFYLSPEFRKPGELAHTIRAYQDFRLGRYAVSLRELDAEKGAYWLGYIASSPLLSQSFERYLRAECLMRLGRDVEALRWFETLEQGTLYDLEFLGASLRAQAEVHRAMGENEAAAAIERRLVELKAR
jgi:DNA-binding SARP family transcriptional activator